MPARASSRTEDSRWFRLSVAALSAVSTGLLVVVLYVLGVAADDLKSVSKGFAALTTRVAVVEHEIANNTANDGLAWKRIGRLEGRVFMMGGDLSLPNASDRP